MTKTEFLREMLNSEKICLNDVRDIGKAVELTDDEIKRLEMAYKFVFNVVKPDGEYIAGIIALLLSFLDDNDFYIERPTDMVVYLFEKMDNNRMEKLLLGAIALKSIDDIVKKLGGENEKD